MVCVYGHLQKMRRETNHLQGNQSFMTLRDLFRWAERYQLTSVNSSNVSVSLAHEGYLILGSRVRLPEEEIAVRNVLENNILKNEKINVKNLFTLNKDTSPITRNYLEQISTIEGFENIVWTYDMRRLFVLVSKAFECSEPVLLVGETGCGKTSVCQMIAALAQKKLRTINCHMHSEGADFLGAIRPTRNRSVQNKKLFEWVDGPLVRSMKEGGIFLADEISLADDNVLERLNPLLETGRCLTLTEKGSDKAEVVIANDSFRFIGTMNPGGDFGKKELSFALRNRFTEVWCPKIDLASGSKDLISIIEHNIDKDVILTNKYGDSGFGRAMVAFLQYFLKSEAGRKYTLSIRDILSWVAFINKMTTKSYVGVAYVDGARLILLDSLGCGSDGSCILDIKKIKLECLQFLSFQVYSATGEKPDLGESTDIKKCSYHFGIEPYFVNNKQKMAIEPKFVFEAPKTRTNLLHLLRGLQLSKPILLEGSPGVGKTSLVVELAKSTGHHISRINLSEQTDVSDLFGADFPVEGENSSRFAWRDGPLLQALKNGWWIVFDEINLASQPVLEGLNACFDHRGTIFVPELNKTFKVKRLKTKIFACQNPQCEGGARKGLPKSFLNRFTKVYCESMCASDLYVILTKMYSHFPQDILLKMIEFNEALIADMKNFHWGMSGGPWEFNLRDMFRWCDIMTKYQDDEYNPGEFVDLIYTDRFRKEVDKSKVKEVYYSVFSSDYPIYEKSGKFFFSLTRVQFGLSVIDRFEEGQPEESLADKSLYILNHQTPTLEALVECVNMNWMTILVGCSDDGKTSLLHVLAKLVGKQLVTFPVNPEMDVTELLGGFEQVQQSDGKGGRTFQWVDSVLVEAVKNGNWLLIDRANLCSPSVLDRLNGLLESGGVLTISERGAVDGQVPTIIPHPNFRLFFSIDPKQGELSRAMRNRGVEICITNQLSKVQDIQALMCSGNLTNFSMQNAMYTVHKLSESEKASKKPSKSTLVHASSLAAKLNEYGQSQIKAMETALEQCYYHCSLSRDARNIIVKKRNASFLDGTGTLIPIDDIIRDPENVRIKQVQTMLDVISSNVPSDLSEWPLSMTKTTKFIIGETIFKLVPIVVLFLADMPCLQWEKLSELCKINATMNKHAATIIETIMHQIGKSVLVPDESFDPRFNIKYLERTNQLCSSVISEANKRLIMLWNAADVLRNVGNFNNRKSACESTNFVGVSKKIYYGKRRTGREGIIIKRILRVKTELGKFFKNVSLSSLEVTDELYFKLLDAYRWFRQYNLICGSKLELMAVPRFSFLWKMLSETLIDPIQKHSILNESMKICVENIAKILPFDCSPINIVAEKMRQTIPTMLPFKRECDYVLLKRLHTIISKIYGPTNYKMSYEFMKRIDETVMFELSKISSNSSIVSNQLPNGKFEDIDLLDALEDEVENMIPIPSVYEFNKVPDLTWRINDYFLCLLSQKHHSESDFKLTKTSYIPADILWLNDNTDRFQFLQSYMFRKSKFELEGFDEGAYITGSCQLTSFIISESMTKSKKKSISIKNYAEYVDRIRVIQATISYNWSYLANNDNSSFNKYHNFVKKFTLQLMKSISDSDSVSHNSFKYQNIEEHIFKCSKIIENYTNSSEHLMVSKLFTELLSVSTKNDPINIAQFGVLSGYLQMWLLSHMHSIDPLVKNDILRNNYLLEKEEIEHMLEAFQSIDILRYSQHSIDSHPHRLWLERRYSKLSEEITHLNNQVCYRPLSGIFTKFLNRIKRFIITYHPVLILELINCAKEFTWDNQLVEFINACEDLIADNIHSFPEYRDIFVPILEGISVTLEGLRLLMSCVRYMNIGKELNISIDFFITDMICFPANKPCEMNANLDHILELRSKVGKFSHFLEEWVHYRNTDGNYRHCFIGLTSCTPRIFSENSLTNILNDLNGRSFLSALYDVYNSVVSEGHVRKKSLEILNVLMADIEGIFNPLNELTNEIKDKNFYFPSNGTFHHVLANDLMPVQLTNESFDSNHFQELITIYKIIMDSTSIMDAPDVKILPYTPFLLRSYQMQTLFQHFGSFGSNQVDMEALSGSLFCNDIILYMLQVEHSTEVRVPLTLCKKPYDFYKDPSIKEALKIVDLLKEAQNENFDHDSNFNEVKQAFVNGSDFSINLPLSRIIYKLETIVLDCQEWIEFFEYSNSFENAGVIKIKFYLRQITEKIKELRNKEMKCFKKVLDIVSHEMVIDTIPCFFEIRKNVLIMADNNDTRSDLLSLVGFLRSTMDSSAVGQYKVLLEYILTFYHQLVLEAKYEDCSRMAEIKHKRAFVLWNVYSYYSQFLPDIEGKLNIVKNSIQTDLNIAISQIEIKSSNIRSIRSQIEKSQDCIYKLMNMWSNELLKTYNQTVSLLITNSSVVKPSITDLPVTNEFIIENELFYDVPQAHLINLIPKCASYMRSTIENFHYFERRLETDQLFFQVQLSCKNYCTSLKNASLLDSRDGTLEGINKVINKRKDSILAILSVINFSNVPSKIANTLSMSSSEENFDTILRNLWFPPQCQISSKSSILFQNINKEYNLYNEYYFRNIYLLSVLSRALKNPHSDVKGDIVVAIKENMYNATTLVHHLHNQLPNHNRDLSKCHFMLDQLKKSVQGVYPKAASKFHIWWLVLSSYLSSLRLTIIETEKIVNILYNNAQSSQNEPFVKLSDRVSFTIDSITAKSEVLEEVRQTVEKLINDLNSAELNKGENMILSRGNMDALETMYNVASSIASTLLSIGDDFDSDGILFKQLIKWANEFREKYSHFQSYRVSLNLVLVNQNMTSITDIDEFKTIFKSVEMLFKKHHQEVVSCDFNWLIDGFKLLLEDFSLLGLNRVKDIFENTLSKLDSDASSENMNVIKCYIPILERYMLMADKLLLIYIGNASSLGKLYSLLLELYTQILQKGWEMPSDVKSNDKIEKSGDSVATKNQHGNREGTKNEAGESESTEKMGDIGESKEKTKNFDNEMNNSVNKEKSEKDEEFPEEQNDNKKSSDKECNEDVSKEMSTQKDSDDREQESAKNQGEESDSTEKEKSGEGDESNAELKSFGNEIDDSISKEKSENDNTEMDDSANKEKTESDEKENSFESDNNKFSEQFNNEKNSQKEFDENDNKESAVNEDETIFEKESLKEGIEQTSEIQSGSGELDEKFWGPKKKIKPRTTNKNREKPDDEINRERLDVLSEDPRVANENLDDEEKTYGDDYVDNFFENNNETVNNIDMNMEINFDDTNDQNDGSFDAEPLVHEKPLFPEYNKEEISQADFENTKEIPEQKSEMSTSNEDHDENMPLDEDETMTYEEYRKPSDSTNGKDNNDSKGDADPAKDGGTEANRSETKDPIDQQSGVDELEEEKQNEYGAIGEKTDDTTKTGQSDAKAEMDAHEGKSSSLTHETNQAMDSNKNEDKSGGSSKRQSVELKADESAAKKARIEVQYEKEEKREDSLSGSKRNADFISGTDSKKQRRSNYRDIDESSTKINIEGDFISEATVERPPENQLFAVPEIDAEIPSDTDMSDVEDSTSFNNTNTTGAEQWMDSDQKMSSLAMQLCEQLRLVLEPTQASKLKGDFRTGKRLNMRKVIGYIASHFRKDKIWMKRIQPNKRTYQILIAVDDSESMSEIKADNMARDGVAMVTKALTLLDAGNVGVVSFGKKTNVLHPLASPFTDEAGEMVFSNLKFDQKESNFAEMLQVCSKILTNARGSRGPISNVEQLLLILSDGQTQACSDAVKRAVRSIRDKRVIVIFLVLDAPTEKYTFRDLCLYDYKEKKIKPFIDSFPFPFYLIVRDMTTLPSDLSTAIREWFAFVSNSFE